jgi:hypothetical protein
MEIKIKDLKSRAEKGMIIDSFFVLLYSDNTFLANQYINEIAKINNKQKVYIDSLNEVSKNTDVFDRKDNNLYILNTEKFVTEIENFSGYKNVIVVCNEIDVKTKRDVVATGNYTNLPKLQEWQILEYLKQQAPGLEENHFKWLYQITKGDIYRVYNEVSKLSMFPKDKQLELFKQINNEDGYSDLSLMTIFDFINSILKKDTRTLATALTEINSIDIEPMGLITLLHRNIVNIIKVKLNTKSTPESLGMNEKQFKAISYNYNNLSTTHLANMLEFITSIDFKLKSGLLQLSNERLIDYIITNMLGYAI